MVSKLRASIKKISVKEKNSNRIILNNICFDLKPNSILALTGKNGSGKSILAKSLTSLLDPGYFIIDGQSIFENNNLLTSSQNDLQEIRKNKIRYVFQDSINCFDPLRKMNYYFRNLKATADEIEDLLEFFLLPSYEKISKHHSYELSGGMAQRISLILAFTAKPELLILDEPTSAVDYGIANLILLKLKEFVKIKSNSVLLITQDAKLAEKAGNNIAVLEKQNIRFIS